MNVGIQPELRRTIGDMVATGEELMTPVSARGRRSAVMVILVLEDEPPLIMLCQQHCSNLYNSGKKKHMKLENYLNFKVTC